MSVISLNFNKYPIAVDSGIKCSSTPIVLTVIANNFNRKNPIFSHNRLVAFYMPEIYCCCYQETFKLGQCCGIQHIARYWARMSWVAVRRGLLTECGRLWRAEHHELCSELGLSNSKRERVTGC